MWENAEEAAAVQRELAELKQKIDHIEGAQGQLDDAGEMVEFADDDDELAAELDDSLDTVEQLIARFEFQRMLGGEHDHRDAVISVNAGAGGTESQDWAQMLMRMLSRWAERREFGVTVLDIQHGDEAGIKSCALGIRGEYAYGNLRSEVGVHRLVRISPFDASKRRHTSFASVSVSPEIDDSVEVDIRDEDLRVDTFRASGAGGQHVNKTDSAIRITHMPSGIVVACQAERSQHKNRSTAMKVLRSRLFEIELQKMATEKAALQGEKLKIEWGSQIRSYVLQPYRMVKDHRTNQESSNTDAVLDGDLDSFIKAFLYAMATGAD